MRARESGQWWVGLSTGAAFAPSFWDRWSPEAIWANVQLGDLNGDGRADLIGRALQSGQWFAGLSTGTTLTTSLWDAWATGVTWADVRLGDLNGDGKADLIGRDLATGQWSRGISNGTAFSTGPWAKWSPASRFAKRHLLSISRSAEHPCVKRCSGCRPRDCWRAAAPAAAFW